MSKDLLIYAGIAAILVIIGAPGWALTVPAIATVSAILRARHDRRAE